MDNERNSSYFDELASAPTEQPEEFEVPVSEPPMVDDEGKQRNYLVVDPSVPGQDWCVLSFVTPDDLSQKRQLYMMDNFLHDVVNENIVASTRDMCRRINAKFFKSMEDRLNTLERSKNPNHSVIAAEMHQIRKDLETDEEEFAKLCTHKHGMDLEDVLAKYEDFKLRRGDLDEKFDEMYGKRTSVMGVKFSGAYPFQDQAVERAKFLAEEVERGVHHYVGQSFHWLPFDPNPDGIKDSRYLNQDLNKLMQEKRESQERANRQFEERKRNLVENANDKNADLKKRLQDKYKKIGGGRKK